MACHIAVRDINRDAEPPVPDWDELGVDPEEWMEDFRRCRCATGQPWHHHPDCQMPATQEDGLCDTCREYQDTAA